MKCVLDCRFVRPQPSGIGTYVRALAARLPALAPDDRFELWVDPRMPDAVPAAPNATLRPVSGDPLGPASLLWPHRIAPLGDADVFHSPQNVLGLGLPCPTLVTVHDVMWLVTPSLVEGNPLLRAVNWPFLAGGAWHALRRATLLLAVSHATADAIRAFDPDAGKRVRVAPNGVEPVFQPPADPEAARARAARAIGTDAPYFLVLGTNQPYKGHEHALRGFARASVGDTRLVLVQRRGGRRGLGRLARALGIEDRVLFRHALSREDIVALMQSATALVHPSLVEGFGLPALEAAACGLPVVASAIPALREVLADAAVHVPPADPGALARALERVAGDAGLRAQMRARGLARAAEYGWDACARATLAAYREIAAMRRA
ncbi:glycosyltransferase family 4 protein [Polyangium aurulentum]|uniref:glycosyltransferase family 4 protein n=1 Tax=Polyangium aurulentum TaxID=2567896 RepID=UPI0010AE2B92|nr:glycosyltransferase family 1 protein [Polyangium aurulentum]UQA56713.1 glycosyltransferase family 4 protein [Polyangium aurulentum]